jgi:dihydroneopterin aldolase / 2-amino-4-hydroxy-6-hydroxymethyldihydropteridine diphosphokinase
MSAIPTRAVIAFGSNLGDREATILEAVRLLAEAGGVEVIAVSDVVETIAVTPEGEDPNAPAYLNGVVLIDTTLEPEPLLDALNGIEASLGRERGARWADRTIDLDIVAYGDRELDTERLTIPHPRAAQRSFVLAPWLALDPAAVLPGRGAESELLAEVTA